MVKIRKFHKSKKWYIDIDLYRYSHPDWWRKWHKRLKLPTDIMIYLKGHRLKVTSHNSRKRYCNNCHNSTYNYGYCDHCLEKLDVPEYFICVTCEDNLTQDEKHLAIHPKKDLGLLWPDSYWHNYDKKKIEFNNYECAECCEHHKHNY